MGSSPRRRLIHRHLPEYILTVPSQIFWVRPVARVLRQAQFSLRNNQPADDLCRHFVVRNQDCQILGHRQKPTVKHPVQSARQRQPVADRVAAKLFHRPNMPSLYFRTPATIPKAQARNGAAKIIGGADLSAKGNIPVRSAGQPFDHWSFERKRAFVQVKSF